LPIVAKMGPTLRSRLERWGFYPAGGGRITIEVEPTRSLRPLEMLRCQSRPRVSAHAIVANLPRTIAERELEVVREKLGVERSLLQLTELKNAQGPGNVLMIELGMNDHQEVVTAFGQHGVPAGTVAAEAIEEAKNYLASELPVGVHLADQLVITFAMSGGGRFRTGPPSRHTLTNIEVVKRFLKTPIECEAFEPRRWEIQMGAKENEHPSG
jgi:RNA 3'-terminal phosphate cyclase (ATP)